jgi:hypothetical protein
VKILAPPLNHSEHIALKQLCGSQGEQCKPFHVHFFSCAWTHGQIT